MFGAWLDVNSYGSKYSSILLTSVSPHATARLPNVVEEGPPLIKINEVDIFTNLVKARGGGRGVQVKILKLA